MCSVYWVHAQSSIAAATMMIAMYVRTTNQRSADAYARYDLLDITDPIDVWRVMSIRYEGRYVTQGWS